MARCPKCGYTMVLLEHRSKYKCAKCGGVFPQHKIELKEFQEFNKKERKADKEAIFGKPQKQLQLTDFEKKQRSLALSKKWRQEHIEEMQEHSRKYYEKNKIKILARQRRYRLASEQRRNERLKWLRSQNIEDSRLKERIKYWRKKQLLLAQQLIEIRLFNAYRGDLGDFSLTFGLSNLLTEQQGLNKGSH